MNVVFYDMEMCCFETSKEVGEIIEIGAVMVNLKLGRVVKEYSVLVKPERDEISEFCTSITGISPKMLKSAVPLKEAMRRLHKHMSPNHYWLSWGSDDVVLAKECGEKGVDLNPKTLINLAPLVRMMFMKNRNFGLKEVCEHFDAPVVSPAHRALPDAQTLANLGLKLLGNGGVISLATSES